MRGDVSVISPKYYEINNTYLSSYDPKKLTKCIRHLDKNNLYCYFTSTSLATGRFKQLDPIKFNLDKHDDDSSRGCVLEVDLEYPKELYEFPNDYL